MEKYPWLSPYTFCGGNPIIFTDRNGLNPVYNLKGEYLGSTSEGFTGMIMIYSGEEEIDFSKMAVADLYAQLGEDIHQLDEIRHKPMDGVQIGGGALSNIWTHIISYFEGERIFEQRFSTTTIDGGRITYRPISDKNTYCATRSVGDKSTIYGTNYYDYESTVENIASSIVVHEWYSHLIHKVDEKNKSHRLAYEAVIKSDLWEKTTDRYKEFNLKNLDIYTVKETNNSIKNPHFIELYNKYVVNKK